MGKIQAEAPRDREAFIIGKAHLREGLTLYARFGDWFAWVCLLALFVLAALHFRNRHKKGATP
jgi:apolipoprotein N-acyltransferase